MAVPTLIRRELKNAIICAIPLGEVVDGVTTSATTWPDNAPTSNWTGFQVPDIEGLVLETETEDEPFLLPRDSGGYGNEPEKQLRSLSWIGTTSKTSSIWKMLQFALSSAAVANTAQAPGVRGQLWVDMAFLCEIRGNNGAIIERWQVLVRATLDDPGAAADPKTSKLKIRFRLLSCGLNTYVAL